MKTATRQAAGFGIRVLAALVLAGMLVAGTAAAAENVAQNSGNWTNAAIWSAGLPASDHDVVIPTNITVTMNGLTTRQINSLSITGTLTHAENGSTEAHKIVLDVAGSVTVASGGAIDATGKGYAAGYGDGAGTSYGGGAYGGEGGGGYSGTRGTPYGSVMDPIRCGSGSQLRRGGGVIVLHVTGALTNNGVISADGESQLTGSVAGGGAGGSIHVTAATLSGTGAMRARGGLSNVGGCGGGSGGRIAVRLTQAGSDFEAFGTTGITAYGGVGSGSWDGSPGAAGTVYLKTQGQTHGELIVNNADHVTAAVTPFTNATYRFDAILTTNAGVMVIETNAALDLDGCVLRSDSRTNSITSRIVFGPPTTGLMWPAGYTNTGTLSLKGTNTWSATNLTVGSGGMLTHEPNGSTEANKLNLAVSGALTILAGGAIDVSKKGYAATHGAGAGISYGGGAHGGEGGGGYNGTPGGTPYGSITNPIRCGSGSASRRGGGAIVLHVTGAFTNNGVIAADGESQPTGSVAGGGAGGSIHVTAATLSGTGTMRAHGGLSNVGGCGGGSGGRIAVRLTQAGSGFETFGTTGITAYGGLGSGTFDGKPGAAGTVYLKAAYQTYGDLIVKNNNLTTTARTPIIPSVTDTTVGNVFLMNKAHLRIEANQMLSAYGSWSNAATLSTASGATVVLAGIGTPTNTIYGTNVFTGLRCQTPGMTLKFEAGGSNAVTESIVLTGAAGSNLFLRSTASPTQWKLNVMASATTKTFQYLDVQDSDARPSAAAISPLDSENSGNNSNWRFAVVGQTNVWNGDTSELWTDGGNWSLARAPETFDARAVFPVVGSGRYPYLAGPVTINELDIQAGASLRTSNQTFTVNGAATIAGALIAAGNETVTFNSNLAFSGAASYTAAQSTLKLGGSGPQAFTPNGNTFHALNIANTNAITITDEFTVRDLTFPSSTADVTFQGGFAATNASLVVSDGATLTFAAGQTYAVSRHLWLRGAAGKPIVLTASGAWSLNAGVYTSVRYVDVTDSDASGGQTLYAFDSTGHGSNPNWDFGSNGKLWVGTDTAWTNEANWLPSGSPGATSHVMIDGSAAGTPRLTNAVTIGRLTAVGLAGPVTLTVDMPFSGSDRLTVTGPLYIGTNATLTHTAGNETTRLAVDVGGSLMLASGGAIDATGKGYAAGYGDGAGTSYGGGAYGGEGGGGYNGTPGGTPYGSVMDPIRCGSGSQLRRGGGVIVLYVTGALTNNGVISADGESQLTGSVAGGGAGGSIHVTAATLSGTGTMRARGGLSNVGGCGGGSGGRIAVRLTQAGSSFDAFGTTGITAYGGVGSGSYDGRPGAAGTIYLQTAGQGAGQGTVTVNNNALTTTARTQIPPAISPTLDELRTASVIVTNRGALAITASDRIASLTVVSANEPLNLGTNGTVLTLGDAMTINGTAYTRGGLYTTNNWNGFAKPANITGGGAIEIRSKGTVLLLR